MKKLSCLATLLAVTVGALGTGPTTAPTSKPTTASAPASKPTSASAPAADEAVMKILWAMEAAGKKFPTIKADVDYHLNKTLLDDTELRTGNVSFSRGKAPKPTQFRIHFATLKLGKSKTAAVRVDYAFDGMWLSKAQHKLRKITRYQYAAPGQQHVDPLQLGKGPFPVPFGQKVADVLKYFKVKLAPPSAKDPPGSVHLVLTTRRKHRRDISYSSLDLWIDSKTHLSVKIRVKERKSRDIITVTFKNIKPGAKLEKGIFTMPRPRGWKETRKPRAASSNLKPG